MVLSLGFMVPIWTLLGAFSTLDSGLPLWWGLAVGGAIGVFFGLVFGGAKGKWLDFVYGPEEPQDGQERVSGAESGVGEKPPMQE
jgi:hypothetical protein